MKQQVSLVLLEQKSLLRVGEWGQEKRRQVGVCCKQPHLVDRMCGKSSTRPPQPSSKQRKPKLWLPHSVNSTLLLAAAHMPWWPLQSWVVVFTPLRIV